MSCSKQFSITDVFWIDLYIVLSSAKLQMSVFSNKHNEQDYDQDYCSTRPFSHYHWKLQKYESIFKAFLNFQYKTCNEIFFSKVAVLMHTIRRNKDPQCMIFFEFSETVCKTFYSQNFLQKWPLLGKFFVLKFFSIEIYLRIPCKLNESVNKITILRSIYGLWWSLITNLWKCFFHYFA